VRSGCRIRTLGHGNGGFDRCVSAHRNGRRPARRVSPRRGRIIPPSPPNDKMPGTQAKQRAIRMSDSTPRSWKRRVRRRHRGGIGLPGSRLECRACGWSFQSCKIATKIARTVIRWQGALCYK